MKSAFLCAAALLVVPAVSVSAMANDPAKSPTEQVKTDEVQTEEPAEAETAPAPAAKEEKLICRRVKLDMSSRRATKVCKTADEWREFNQRR